MSERESRLVEIIRGLSITVDVVARGDLFLATSPAMPGLFLHSRSVEGAFDDAPIVARAILEAYGYRLIPTPDTPEWEAMVDRAAKATERTTTWQREGEGRVSLAVRHARNRLEAALRAALAPDAE